MTRDINRRTFLTLATGSVFALAACGGKADNSSTTETMTTSQEPAEESYEPGTIIDGVLVAPYDNKYNSGTHHATIEVESFGTIKVELDADIAPITVSNFGDLVESGFYDGLTFHRIVKDFVVQGGDPNGNGTGGSGTYIRGEFLGNGVENPIKHERGVISMARSQHPDSASSQFFIMHQAAEHLDGAYAAFGKVIEGIEVVDKLAEVTVEDSNGTVAPENQPVITSIVMDD